MAAKKTAAGSKREELPRSTKSSARGRVLARETGAGDVPAAEAAIAAPTREQQTTQERLSTQREAGGEAATRAAKAQQEAIDRTATPGNVFTAVSRNGLEHRRNGIIFGAEPVTVDVTSWSKEQRERFFNDSFLMIVAGQRLGAAGAPLVPAGTAREFLGGGGEVATPDMIAAAADGRAMRHPATLGAGAVVGGAPNRAATDLERSANNTE